MSYAVSEKTDGSNPRWPIAVVLLATIAVYARSLFQGFVWDDGPVLIRNKGFNPPTLYTLSYYWSHPSWNLYQPLTCTLWAACAKIGFVSTPDENGVHLSPVPFHVLNVTLHTLATLGVYRLMRTLRLSNRWAAVGAALFALHPIQVESVAFAGQLNTPLFGCLAVFALDLYLRSIDESLNVDVPAATNRSTTYGSATVLYVLAMLAQPVALILPAIAVSIDRLTHHRSWRLMLRPAYLWIVLAIPFAIVTKLNQHGLVAASLSPPESRPFIALDNLAVQALHVICPVGLTVDYGRSPGMLLSHPSQLLSGFATVLLATLSWQLRKIRPLTTAGLAMAAIALLPSSGLVPFDFEEFSTVADRHAYFAMIGFALAAVDLLRHLPPRPAIGAAMVTLVVLAGTTFRQIGFWKDDATLFGRGVALNPSSWICHNNLGAALMLSDPPAAMQNFAACLSIHPENTGTYDNYAMSAMNAGEPAAAVKVLNEGLRSAPDNAALRQRLAEASELLARPSRNQN